MARAALARSAFEPPLMNAAGTIRTVEQLTDLLDTPMPAVLVGSFTLEERPGNPGDNFYADDIAALNSMGLPSPACSVWVTWVEEMRRRAHDHGKQLWVSVAGFGPQEWGTLVDAALTAGADVVEANFGCPNVWSDGVQKPIVGYSPDEVTRALHEIERVVSADATVGVKLSPIFDPVVLEAVDAVLGASPAVGFVTTTNTVPNCFGLRDDGRPAIEFGEHLGGMSGPAVKWVGLGQVLQHRTFLPDLPIVGVGGIETGADLLAYLSLPADVVCCQFATAFWRRGKRAVAEILQEYVSLLEE